MDLRPEPTRRQVMTLFLANAAFMLVAFIALDRWIPERYATEIGVTLYLVVLIALVVVPLVLYRRGRRSAA